MKGMKIHEGLALGMWGRCSRSPWDLRVLRQSHLLKLCLVDEPSCAHFCEQLGYAAQGPLEKASVQ